MLEGKKYKKIVNICNSYARSTNNTNNDQTFHMCSMNDKPAHQHGGAWMRKARRATEQLE